ncbi:hypothetical protein JRO89_XS14G0159300 [Xanthoceras sorbifolium]|uniref:DUF4283 domain-containing protein n=1 Tax=Xanthoceras sorbifolium TaxID=99658 RepID=A0ABQ8H5F2_9ROSI|nr:hypothetical protein JRO89_XS14G0159300 [Xanthoceras sorbifolium]
MRRTHPLGGRIKCSPHHRGGKIGRNAMDHKRVLEGGPWNFDNALLVPEIPTGFGDFTNMEFRWTTFWIQIHNIPPICMTKQVGIQLGQHIGTVKEIDVGSIRDRDSHDNN